MKREPRTHAWPFPWQTPQAPGTSWRPSSGSAVCGRTAITNPERNWPLPGGCSCPTFESYTGSWRN
eukprot:881726-Pyramimonas_sp.AAC.1